MEVVKPARERGDPSAQALSGYDLSKRWNQEKERVAPRWREVSSQVPTQAFLDLEPCPSSRYLPQTFAQCAKTSAHCTLTGYTAALRIWAIRSRTIQGVEASQGETKVEPRR